ncbi:hypothetical protein FHG87_006657 [Trinorchestia longiramus]|nr:hypothetical protein FHG87_006657 [Trinorchestia longiramus]
MKHIVEEPRVMEKEQNGFRKDRRGEDNLFVVSASGRQTTGSKPGNEYELFLVSRRELALIGKPSTQLPAHGHISGSLHGAHHHPYSKNVNLKNLKNQCTDVYVLCT